MYVVASKSNSFGAGWDRIEQLLSNRLVTCMQRAAWVPHTDDEELHMQLKPCQKPISVQNPLM